MDNFTKSWKLYEKGKDYFNKIKLVSNTNDAYRFYEGDHWRGLQSGGEKMPIVEIVKPIVDYKTAVLTQNDLHAIFSAQSMDEEQRQQQQEICDQMGYFWRRYWENNNMDSDSFDIITDGLIAGDSHIYMYFDENKEILNGKPKQGEVKTEIIPNSNIMFGDENEKDVQKQPYILLLSRRTVKELQQIAKQNKIKQEEIDKIQPDENKDVMTGDINEVEHQKCLCIMRMWRENGKVHIEKSTRTMVYQEDTELPIELYPIASFVPNVKHGSCRGTSEVCKLIPNQIWVNRLEAYRLISTKMYAFPKLVYSSAIVNKEDIDMPGVGIEVSESDNVKSARDSVDYINPAPMSQDAQIVLKEIMDYTKDAAGASDIATGRQSLDNATALLAIQESSQAPLKFQTEKYKRFVEDVSRILYDFWCSYFTNGLEAIVTDEMGNQIPFIIDNDTLRNMTVDIRVDISPKSPLNTLTEQQKVDNLLINGQITFDEYAYMTLDSEPLKPKLQRVVEKRQIQMMQQQQMMAQQQMIEEQNMALDQASSQYMELENAAQNMAGDAFMEGAIASAAAVKEGE